MKRQVKAGKIDWSDPESSDDDDDEEESSAEISSNEDELKAEAEEVRKEIQFELIAPTPVPIHPQ